MVIKEYLHAGLDMENISCVLEKLVELRGTGISVFSFNASAGLS